MRKMPIKLQIHTIKKVFNSFNRKEEPDDLDFDNLDPKCDFHENLQLMANAHPQFNWEKPDVMIRRYDQAEKDYNARLRIDAGLEPEDSESFSKTNTHWKVERNELGEIYSIEIEIKPRTTVSKGIKYTYGRIQLSIADPTLVGLKAKITVLKPKKS